jgi:hypothetical protein
LREEQQSGHNAEQTQKIRRPNRQHEVVEFYVATARRVNCQVSTVQWQKSISMAPAQITLESTAHANTDRSTVQILAATLFLSAFLLFMCQPMVGKMLLPYLGGAASVWTTCVLFFQFMLLLGYIYAHFVARMSNVRKQILTHAAVVLLPLAFLPIQFEAVSSESFSLHPVRELLGVLLGSVAIPFFVVPERLTPHHPILTFSTPPAMRAAFLL